jgi:hypothetical protein
MISHAGPVTDGDLKKYGITRRPVDYFHYGKFRYANIEDAIAEAKRDQGSN